MQVFDINSVEVERAGTNRAWLEFLRAGSLSVGIYHLHAGQADSQQPHTEDELYYVLRGKASFRAGDQTTAVSAGTLIFVERAHEHRFDDITEDLTVLVVFAPPDGALKPE